MTTLPAPDVVFAGRHMRAAHVRGSRDRLIVTFDFRKIGRSGFGPIMHSSGFARQGYGQLFITTAANDWFINPDTLSLEQALHEVAVRYRSIGLLGYSMGGYGALRFARALGAVSAVLISPQASISADVVPFERRYRTEATGFDPALGDLAPQAMSALGGLILIDPFFPADLQHARLITALFPGLRLVRLNFGGHPAIRVLRGANAAWWVQRAALQVRPEARPILAAHRAARAGSAGYWLRLANHAQRRRPELAAFARARAATLGPRPGDAEDTFALDGPAESP